MTGGAGNVGSHIVDAAVAAGAREVVALDALVRGVPENLAGAVRTGKARLVEIDIRDREAVRANLAGADFVFHQAALRWTRCQELPRECHEVMVDGTFNVLEAAAEANVRRVVLASSAVVYADTARLPIDEGKPLTLFGDGSASADFVYIADVVRANLLACEARTTDAIVNVCSGVETRMRDLATLLLEVTGSGVGMEFKPEPPRALPARRFGDPRRAERELGFRAETKLADGVRRLVEWRREALATAAGR